MDGGQPLQQIEVLVEAFLQIRGAEEEWLPEQVQRDFDIPAVLLLRRESEGVGTISSRTATATSHHRALYQPRLPSLRSPISTVSSKRSTPTTSTRVDNANTFTRVPIIMKSRNNYKLWNAVDCGCQFEADSC